MRIKIIASTKEEAQIAELMELLELGNFCLDSQYSKYFNRYGDWVEVAINAVKQTDRQTKYITPTKSEMAAMIVGT